jgi:hypothetical protein
MSLLNVDPESFWEDFLPFVEDRRVVPVLGPDLLQVEIDGTRRHLHTVVAGKLAERLRVDVRDLPEPGLNDVVVRFLQARGRREDVYPKIRAVMKDLTVAPPLPLRQLARIRHFDLFLSLGFDSLLVQALDEERFRGEQRTEHLAYAPHKVVDLPGEVSTFQRPVVYSLFGKLSVGPDYVITDEDKLEFLYALQSDTRRPHLLFDELQSSHLLFLGCSFPDWLARFFIRIAKSRQLSQQRGESELLVHPGVNADRNLVLFLENFSYGTRLLPMEPSDFVAELHRRWCARNAAAPEGAAALDAAAAAGASAEPRELPAGGVFVSYAKEDFPAAQRISAALEELGLDVWFDKDRLEAGDQYDQKIKRNIKACSLFVPIVSATTERRMEGYFRREWKLAEERSWAIADGVPFIVPVVIDETPPYGSMVPEAFHKAQWTQLREGAITPEFESRLVKLVRDYRKREKGLAA